MTIKFVGAVKLEDNEETVDIIEQDGHRFVMVPLEDYPGMAETAHLLKSDANAAELEESIEWLNNRASTQSFDGSPDSPQFATDGLVDALFGVSNDSASRARGISPKDARVFGKVLAWAEHTVDSPEGLTPDDLDHLRMHIVRHVLPSFWGPLPEGASEARQGRREQLFYSLVHEHDFLLGTLRGEQPKAPAPATATDNQKATAK